LDSQDYNCETKRREVGSEHQPEENLLVLTIIILFVGGHFDPDICEEYGTYDFDGCNEKKSQSKEYGEDIV
jgi:hypothetical protein